MPAPLLWIALPVHAVKTAGHYALSYFRDAGRAYRRGVRAGLGGAKAALDARGAIQRTRTAPVSRIAAALTWSPFALRARAAKIRTI
jgi:N-acetylglucosaminyl-diphospho-decaprenol L-rhamnosyltransferase